MKKSLKEKPRLKRISIKDQAEKTNLNDDLYYLNVYEAAIFLRSTTGSLYKKVCDRTIPFKKFGGRLLFEKKELIAFIDSSSKIKNEDSLI